MTRPARFTLALLLTGALTLPAPTPATAEALPPPLQVLRSDSTGMLLEIQAPAYTLHGTAELRATVPGWPADDAAGAPALPLLRMPLWLPTPLTPTIRLLDDDQATAPLPAPLARNPLPVPSPAGSPPSPAFAPAALPLNGIAPAAPVTLGPLIGQGQQTLAMLQLAPLQVDWGRSLLHHHRRMRVEVRYASASPTATTLATPPGSPNAAARTAGSLRLLVSQPGIHEVTAGALQAAGWNLASLPLERLQLTRDGQEVPLEITGQGEGLLLRFRGEPAASRYQAAQSYWLFVGGQNGLRGPATPGPGTPLRWEENSFYGSQYTAGGHTAGERDGWFARSLRLIDDSTRSMTASLTLPAALPAGTPIAVAAQSTIPAFHTLALTVTVGSVTLPLGEQSWSDANSIEVPPARTVTFTLPASLPPGTALLTLAIASRRTIDEVYIDRLTVPTVLLPDASGLLPTVVADTPSDLGNGGGDYLIISHGAFLGTLAPLVAMHQQKGRAVRVVDVQDVYDEWGYGQRDPEAIRAFVAHASRFWNIPPRDLLLVGDGTVDFKDYLGKGEQTFVPPYLARADPWLGEVACDTCFARVAGPGGAAVADVLDDPLPDLAVGRLPVQTVAQAQAVVAKIVGYGTKAPPGSWRNQQLFLADRSRDEQGQSDFAGDFWALSDTSVALLPAGTEPQRFYYDPSPLQAGEARPAHHVASSAALRRLFLGAFDRGAALVTYTGHSSFWQWGSAAIATPPYLWQVYDADTRTNGGKLPILLSLTCLTGLFQEPTSPDLGTTDERLLLQPNGGTVASLSPSGLSVARGHDKLYAGTVAALYSANPASRSLGAAQRAGFAAILSGGCCSDMVYSYQLFGDPATTLPQGTTQSLWLPLIRR